MATLRVRIELNKGGVGIRGDKLVSVAKDALAFLTNLCKDLKIQGTDKDWVACNFENNSVDFDFQLTVRTKKDAERGTRAVKSVMKGDTTAARRYNISRETTVKYANIANAIDPDEIIRFGVYKESAKKPDDWFKLDKATAAQTERKITQSLTYYGQVQCIVSAFYKEAKRPRIDVIDLSNGATVKCFFNPTQYSEAVRLLDDPKAVVFVEGEVEENMIDSVITSIAVQHFTVAPHFNKEKYEAFLGKYPDILGNGTADQYVAGIRSSDGN